MGGGIERDSGGKGPSGATGLAGRGSAALLGCLLAAGCAEDSSVTGPEGLLPRERAVVEEIAVERILDLVWVAEGSHGGMFPHLAFAFELPGGDLGYLGSVTVDPSHDPGLFEPYCSASTVEGVHDCLRIRKHLDGSYELQVYYTVPPDRTPRERPELAYDGREPFGTVRYRPQPLLIWTFRMDGGGTPISVAAEVEERFTVTSTEGPPTEVVVEGLLEADLDDPREARAELSVTGLAACEELRIGFDGMEEGAFGGEIRCGGHRWADIVFTPGTPPQVVWLD